MTVQALRPVVLKVRSLQRSEEFYSGMLGMPIVLRVADPRMTFFSLRSSVNHHDFALIEVGFDASSPDDDTTDLLTWRSTSAVQQKSLVSFAACSMPRGRPSSAPNLANGTTSGVRLSTPRIHAPCFWRVAPNPGAV
jgi:hypothetical protein